MLPRVLLAVAGVLASLGLVVASATVAGRAADAGVARAPTAERATASGDAFGDVGTFEEATTAPPATAPSPPPGDAAATSEATAVAAPKPASRPPGAPAPAPKPPPKRPPPRPNRTSEAPTQPEPTPAPTPVAPAPTSTARYGQDFPDPFVFRAGAYWYAMSTQRGLAKVPVIRSLDLVHWEDRGDALPALPQWSHFGAVWAPSVLTVTGGFVLYYATPDEETGLQCISMAVSALPEGPYVDTSSAPFICQSDRGGSIDPSPFRDADGRPWLVWKSEGTIEGEPTRIWSQPLSEDGRGLFGAPTELLATSLPWERPIVEAPTMARLDGDGAFHLFYSGNRWETSAYGIGHARCDGPAGPCHRTSGSSVLAVHPSEAGGGSGEVFVAPDGSPKLAYHAWDPSAVGYPGGLRRLRIGSIRLANDGSGGAVVEPAVP